MLDQRLNLFFKPVLTKFSAILLKYQILPNQITLFSFSLGIICFICLLITFKFSLKLDYLENIGMSEITNHEKQLTNYCLDKLHKIENIKIHGSAKSRIGVISFNIKNIHPHDLAQFLNEYNIAVRVGHHCAQPLLSKLNETATARLSTYLYNDEQDIDKLCKALNEIISYFT